MDLFGSDSKTIKKLQEEIARLEGELSDLKQKLSNAQSENSAIMQDKTTLTENLAALTKLVEELKVQVAQNSTLHLETDRLRTEISNANTRLSELEALGSDKPHVSTSPPVQAQTTVSADETTTTTGNNTGELCRQLDRIEKFVADIDYKDQLIKNLHNELQQRSGDFIAQLKRPYLKSIIRIHERIANTLSACEKPEIMSDPNAFAKAVKMINSDLLMIQDMLDDEYDMVYFRPTAGDKFDPKFHNALKTLPAPSPEKAGTIAECSTGGFIDNNSGKVIKTAIVAVYKSSK